MIQVLTEIRLINGIPAGSFFSVLIIGICAAAALIYGIRTIIKGKQVHEFGKVYNAEILSKRRCYKNTIYVTLLYTDNWGNNKMIEVKCYSSTYYRFRKRGGMRVIEFGSEVYEYYYAPSVFKGVMSIVTAVLLAGLAVFMFMDSRIF